MSSEELIKSAYSHYIIIGCSVVGLVWGGVNAMFVSDHLSALFRLLWSATPYSLMSLTNLIRLLSSLTGQQGETWGFQHPSQQGEARRWEPFQGWPAGPWTLPLDLGRLQDPHGRNQRGCQRSKLETTIPIRTNSYTANSNAWRVIVTLQFWACVF